MNPREVAGGDQRFVAVCDQGLLEAPAGLLLAAAEDQKLAQPELLAETRQRGGGHQRGLQLGLVSLFVLRKPPEEQVGDDEAEDRVAEELQRLIVDDAAAGILVHP